MFPSILQLIDIPQSFHFRGINNKSDGLFIRGFPKIRDTVSFDSVYSERIGSRLFVRLFNCTKTIDFLFACINVFGRDSSRRGLK